MPQLRNSGSRRVMARIEMMMMVQSPHNDDELKSITVKVTVTPKRSAPPPPSCRSPRVIRSDERLEHRAVAL